jgi:hypothetical protein
LILDWFGTLNEVINLRSFSNLWYWIVLAVMWSSASFRIMGVPYDFVQRAASQGGQSEVDLNDIARINANRLNYIAEVSGLWIVAFGTFFLTFLGLSGFVYGFQLAQAVFLLAFPMSFVGLLSLRLARHVLSLRLSGAELRKALTFHRMMIQLIAILSIFVTALWGMYQNLSHMMPAPSL